MTKSIIFNKISELLQQISSKNEALKKGEENIHKIDVDILKSKIRELYEVVGELDSLEVIDIKPEENITEDKSTIQFEAIKEVIDEETIEKESLVEIDEKDIPVIETPSGSQDGDNDIEKDAVKPETIIEEIVVEQEKIVEETVVEQEKVFQETNEKPIDDTDSPQDKEEQIKKEEKLPPPKTGDLFSNVAIGTIADKFKNTQQSLYDKFSDSKDDNSISGKMQKQHINDLKNAIGINEKFLFMNELFDGVLDNYNNAINKLNTFENLDDALVCLKDLETKYKWDESIQSYKQLKGMIERKFN
ncbi:MAG: hypothetical protein K9J13_09920 [Saprospiraceae bacterium]|nr:hypothetical protein [Saprospiraceae bacterium]